MDPEARKRFLLKVIEMVHEQNQDIKEVINIKNLVNDNEGKVKVMTTLIHSPTRPSSPRETATASFMNESVQFDSLEDKIREAEDENSHLDAEIKALNAKYSTLEREVKRSRQAFDGRDIDEEIKAAEKKIRQLEDRL